MGSPSYTADQESRSSSQHDQNTSRAFGPAQTSPAQDQDDTPMLSDPSLCHSSPVTILRVPASNSQITNETLEEMELRHIKEESEMFKLHRQRLIDTENKWDDRRVQIYASLLKNIKRKERVHAELEEPLDSILIHDADPHLAYRRIRSAAWEHHIEQRRVLKNEIGEERLRLRFRHEQEALVLEQKASQAEGKEQNEEVMRCSNVEMEMKQRWTQRWICTREALRLRFGTK